MANRIAEELKTEPGGCIGYKVRFSDHVSDNTMVKLMTDGILLAEIQQDRLLMQYDTIIIDEAHERSLNIDFLLGYFERVAAARSDLKIIITSATIDPERFSRHFNNAPIIESLVGPIRWKCAIDRLLKKPTTPSAISCRRFLTPYN
ncbi:hypothetical protein ACLBOM_20285 [Escherichia coli]